MEIDNSVFNRRISPHEDETHATQGNKKNGQGEKKVVAHPTEEGAQVATLREACPGTPNTHGGEKRRELQKKKEKEGKLKRLRGQIEKQEKRGERKENGERSWGGVDEENRDIKLQEVETLAGRVLGDASRDKGAEQWRSSFTKCAICDSQKLKGIISEYADTDEWRLSKVLVKEGGILSVSVLTYIYRRGRMALEGAEDSVASLYVELGEREEEAYVFLKIRGAAYEILRYMEETLMTREMKWSTQGPNFSKSLMGLGDKEEEKGVSTTVINAGGGGDLARVPIWRKLGHKQVASANQGKHHVSRKKTRPQNWEKKEMSQRKAANLQYGRLLAKTDQSLPHG